MHKEAKDFSELWKEKSDYFESLLVYLTVCSFCINRPDIIPNFPPTEKDIALYGKEIERGVSIPGKIAEDFFPWPPQVFKEKLLMLNKVKVSQHEYVYAYLMVLIAECLGLSGVYHWLWAYDKK